METIYKDGTYGAHNPTMGTEGSGRKAEEIALMLDRHGIKPSSICDIGCGAGKVLAELSRRYPEARCVGYDLQPEAIERARPQQTSGLTFELRNAADITEHFDVLLCLDVIEHVDDLYGFLRTVKPIATHHVFRIPLDLSAQGLLRVSGMELCRKKLGHIHTFNRHSAIWSLEETGYTISDWRYLHPMPHFKGQPTKQRIATFPRNAAYKVSPELTVRMLGGFSLQVLTS